MCGACAIAVVGAASGARAAIATRVPRRWLKPVTIVLATLAVFGASITLSGSA